MSHTPGPWSVKGETYIIAGNQSIALVRVPLVGNSDEDKANARLIAAAPELLEACRQAEDRLSRSGNTNDWGAIEACRDAIRKAEGQS